MKQSTFILLLAIVLIGVARLGWFLLTSQQPASMEREVDTTSATEDDLPQGTRTLPGFPTTDLGTATIPVDQILSGGPGKDGIPAVSAPKFIFITEANIDDDIEGVLIDIQGEQRFYPFTILVWHEIVNDQIGDIPFSVTFCPLCGSAITFDRRLEGRTLEFGVSGYLFESNLLMFDRETESLWSQAIGTAVAGAFVDTQLSILPMQQITFAELRSTFPSARVMSTDTGYRRNYGLYPYGDYAETERTIFPVSVSDQRFFAKEIMYVIPVGDVSVALSKDALVDTASREVNGSTLVVTRAGGLIHATLDGETVPGYFEMWFSWATHHQEEGIVWKM